MKENSIKKENKLILHVNKFYDNRNRRLSIFIESTDVKNIFTLIIFTCSKKDVFTKKTAWKLYKEYSEEGKHSPIISTMNINFQDSTTKNQKDIQKIMLRTLKAQYKHKIIASSYVPRIVMYNPSNNLVELNTNKIKLNIWR